MGKVGGLISNGGMQEVTYGHSMISQELSWRRCYVSLHQAPISNTQTQAAAFPFCLTLVLIPLICTRWRPLLQCCRSVVQTPRVVAKEREIYLGIVELGFSIKKTKNFHFGKWGKTMFFLTRQMRRSTQELQKKCKSLGCSDSLAYINTGFNYKITHHFCPQSLCLNLKGITSD